MNRRLAPAADDSPATTGAAAAHAAARVRVAMLFDGNEQYGLPVLVANVLSAMDRARVTPVGVFLGGGEGWRLLGPCFEEAINLGLGPLLPFRRPGGVKYDPLYLAGRAVILARVLRRLPRAIRGLSAHVLHTHTPIKAYLGWRATRRLPIRRVWHCHGPYPYAGRASRRFIRFAHRGIDRIVAISHYVASTFPPELAERVRVIHNGVPCAALRAAAQPGEFRARFGVPPGQPLVGIFGAIVPRKGHRYFVEAAAQVAAVRPDVRFAVVGGTTDSFEKLGATAALAAQIARYGLTDRFIDTGFLPDATRLMCDFDVIAMPSIEYEAPLTEAAATPPVSDRPRSEPVAPATPFPPQDEACVPPTPTDFRPGEPFGLVMIEAMAQGVATIASDCGAPPEVIRHGVNGLLVPPRDGAALARAILELLADDERRSRIARAGARTVAAHFDARNSAARLVDLYEELVGPVDEPMRAG